MTTVYMLSQRTRNWTGSDDVDLLGVFSTQENAVRWLRKYRYATGDTEPAIPTQGDGWMRFGERYWISSRELDPEPITREQWLSNVSGATAIAGSNDA